MKNPNYSDYYVFTNSRHNHQLAWDDSQNARSMWCIYRDFKGVCGLWVTEDHVLQLVEEHYNCD
jgi:hypothetical protein